MKEITLTMPIRTIFPSGKIVHEDKTITFKSWKQLKDYINKDGDTDGDTLPEFIDNIEGKKVKLSDCKIMTENAFKELTRYPELGLFCNKATAAMQDTFDFVLHRFMQRDIDGVSTAEEKVLKMIWGNKEEAFRDLRELYPMIERLGYDEYCKGKKYIYNRITKIYKEDKEAGKQAMRWFNTVRR